MNLAERLWPAVGASAKHLGLSLFVALTCAALVFFVWYPYPFSELVGGRELFFLVISVDVVCGPLLTLIAYNKTKPKRELYRDLGIIVFLQLASLAYGISCVLQARPLFVAFEGDRFRVVNGPDVDMASLDKAAPDLRNFSFSGPQLLGVRLATSTDKDFLQSLQLSIDGLHPSFRPERWVRYEDQRQEVIANLRSLDDLEKKNSGKRDLIETAVQRTGLDRSRLGYVPLIAGRFTDWVVLMDRNDAEIKAYLPVDGW